MSKSVLPVTSIDAARYKIKQALIKEGLNPDDYIIQTKVLRVARPLVNGQGVDGPFDIQRTKDSKTIPYETLLEPTSLFGMIAISAKVAKIDANGYFVGGHIPASYPERLVFADGEEPNQLPGMWYGGKLEFKSNESTTRFADLDLMNCMVQPNRISAAGTDKLEFGASFESRGWMLIPELPMVEGGIRNEFFHKWGAYAKTEIEGADDNNHMVLEILGVEIKNAAPKWRQKMGDNYDNVCNAI